MFPGWFEHFVNICLPKNILINKRFSTTLVHIFHISHNIWAIFTLTINNQGWRFRRQTQQFFWSRFAFQPLNNTLGQKSALCATKYLGVPNNLSWHLFVYFNCECSEEQFRGWLHIAAEDKVGWKHSLSSDRHQPGINIVTCLLQDLISGKNSQVPLSNLRSSAENVNMCRFWHGLPISLIRQSEKWAWSNCWMYTDLEQLISRPRWPLTIDYQTEFLVHGDHIIWYIWPVFPGHGDHWL